MAYLIFSPKQIFIYYLYSINRFCNKTHKFTMLGLKIDFHLSTFIAPTIFIIHFSKLHIVSLSVFSKFSATLAIAWTHFLLSKRLLKIWSRSRRVWKEPLKKQVDTNQLLKLYSQTSHNITLHFFAFSSQDFEEFLLKFQSEQPVIHLLYSSMEKLILFDAKICC